MPGRSRVLETAISNVTSVIETVGAFAGLIALIGLLVLSFLVISQARDLRRLREWGGAARERDAELREVSEVVAERRSEEIRAMTEREERRASFIEARPAPHPWSRRPCDP